MGDGSVVAVAGDSEHRFSKQVRRSIDLIEDLGVRGDAHEGITVKHRSRVAIDPTLPNLRQVHLLHSELLDELGAHGFDVQPGDLGENVTTQRIDLLALPTGTLLMLGDDAVIEVTGLRNPCAQIERFQTGLLAAVLDRGPDNEVIRKAGIMAVVRRSGTLRAGDPIIVRLPAAPHVPLAPV